MTLEANSFINITKWRIIWLSGNRDSSSWGHCLFCSNEFCGFHTYLLVTHWLICFVFSRMELFFAFYLLWRLFKHQFSIELEFLSSHLFKASTLTASFRLFFWSWWISLSKMYRLFQIRLGTQIYIKIVSQSFATYIHLSLEKVVSFLCSLLATGLPQVEILQSKRNQTHWHFCSSLIQSQDSLDLSHKELW